ncbi:FAD/NAD(P)-binding domain-containing protein [Hyaloscypha variabilis F]|uniref:FAD/NAD(P)-binding domain-containing protein n=1 Tax=Hyaloscypha variabilis (strain UAMH 11265 / GT02V1 / F) TaxID=1149755 RepID=A0A2J6RGJ4_HYAVF|nr:FAD/NAD(P)-binding domain-containing protein [Hyaloscypha variabilis F]
MSNSYLRKSLRVLVSGAGIGGPVLAYWLGKAGASVTLLERADRLRKEGQTVDINNEARTIVKWMGVEEAIRKVTTKEAGVKFVDSKNKIWAAFAQSNEGTSPTSEFEIVRGELANVFYEASKYKAEYIFGDSIASIQETETGVQVVFSSKTRQTREYDLIVVAEGLASRTRALAFDEDLRAPIHPLHMWVASFSFEQGESDDQWARMYNAINRRGLLIRPDGFGRVRANAMFIDESGTLQAIAGSRDQDKLKEHFINLFNGAGWETDRIMDGLREADDFYLQEVAQAKCKTWSKGRVVLVGDTAYCPSPLSGMGTTAAIVGSYVLAAKIIKHQHDHRTALTAYEATLRPWIEDIQKIFPGAPQIGLPETQWGIGILRTFLYVLSFVVKSGVFDVLSNIGAFGERFSSSGQKKLKLPDPSVFKRSS